MLPAATPKRSAGSALPRKKDQSHTLRHERVVCVELEGHCAEDQRKEHQHHREIEAGEHRRVHVGERGEDGARSGEEPDLIAVPHRADRRAHDLLLVIVLGNEGVERAETKVETVEQRVASEEHADQSEPDHT